MRTTPDQQTDSPPGGTSDAAEANPPARRGLADQVTAAPALGVRDSLGRETLIKIAVLAVLMAAAHARQLYLLGMQCYRDPDWRHGFVIPLFSIYLLYTRRDELLAASRRTGALGFLGLAILVVSLLAQPICVYPIRNYWLMHISMVWSLFGLVLYLGGASIIRLTWLPILFLLFALPISPTVYQRISVPLQNVSAAGAVAILKLLGVPISRVASNLTLTSQGGVTHSLTVAEACNGMRLLTAFLALAVAMAYLDDKPIWQRVILVGAGIPIAVICNIIRVAITCYMYRIDREAWGQDFMHYFAGMLMLIPAFGMLWLLAWMLRSLYAVGDEDQEETPADAEEGLA
ncbi:MAG: exosortase/archaeosortase family protein [Planctomycetota bacterium]|jgi:exosortase